MEKWYKGVYRRQLTDMHISDDSDEYLSKFDEDIYYENLLKAHIQSPMIYLQAHTGLCYFPTKVARTHKAMTGENNAIKRLIAKCKDGGMKVVGYYSLIFNNYIADKHRDWEIIDKDGKTWRDRGRRYGLCCPNNAEYREFLAENIKEMGEYFTDIDGIFYDMPFWEMPCCCDSCKKRYKEETGKELPTTEDWDDLNWLTFVKKRQDWMTEFTRFVKCVSDEVFPNATCEMNFSASLARDWIGGSTEGINEVCEFTGADLYGDLYNHSFTAKYYYGISKNQPFEYMTCRCNHDLKEHTISKTKEMLETEILLTCAHHGATLNIDAINPDGTLDERVYKRVGEAFEKQIAHEEYMDKGVMHADVAVYFDSKTQFNAKNHETYNKLCAINAHKTLVENHIPTAIIANGNMNDLGKYKMIIAPCLQDFDNDEPLKLIDFVKEGGTLYLSGKSDSRLMTEFFGAKFNGYTFGKSTYPHIKKEENEVQAYIAPVGKQEIFGEFNEKYPLPIIYKLPVFEFKEGRVCATVTLPPTDPDNNWEYASIHSNPPMVSTEIPAFVETSYGKGKVVWCSAYLEFDERINFKKILIGLVKKFVEPKYKVKTNKFVESVIFEDNDTIYASFVDINEYYDTDERSFSIEVPSKVKSAVNLTSGETLQIENDTIKGKFQKFCMIKILV